MFNCCKDSEDDIAMTIRTLAGLFRKKLARRGDGEYYPISADIFEGHITEAPVMTTATSSATPTWAMKFIVDPEPVPEPVVAPCPPGNYLNGNQCEMCGKNTYSVEFGVTSCTPCEEGFRTNTGSVVCKIIEKIEKPQPGEPLPESGTAAAPDSRA